MPTSGSNAPMYKHGPLTTSLALSYALPALPLAFLFAPMAVVKGIYAKYFGLTLVTIATVLLIARLFDAVTDLAIGYCTDRYYARGGSRKPFVACGGVLFIVAGWFLYVPPSNVGPGYFLGWLLAFYFSYTLFEIPHLAWGSDLAVSAVEKNKVYALRSFFALCAGLLFYAMPLLPVFETSEITPQTLKWTVLAAGILMLPMLYLCLKSIPDSRSSHRPYIDEEVIKKDNLREVLRTVVTNKPFVMLLAACICKGLGMGMWAVLLFLFVDTYLGLGEKFALVFLISTGISMVFLKPWYHLANYWGKQVAWEAGMILMAIGMLGTGLLSPDHIWLLLLLCVVLIYAGLTTLAIMGASLLSDIVDYGTLKSGTDRAAVYFSLFTLINKTVGALGGAAGLALAGWYGFDPTQTVQSESAVFGLHLSMAWIPALLVLLALILIARIPISAHRHAIILRRLDSRRRRAEKAGRTEKIETAIK